MAKRLFRAIAGAAVQKVCNERSDRLMIDAPNADLRGLVARAKSFIALLIPDADVEGASLAFSRLGLVGLWGVHGEGLDLNHCAVFEGTFADATIPGADLTGALFVSVCFDGADLSGSVVEDTTMLSCSFRSSDLQRTTLERAYCLGCAFEDAELGGTSLDPTAEVEPIDDAALISLGVEVFGDYVIGYCPRLPQSPYDLEYQVGQRYRAPVFSVAPVFSRLGLEFATRARAVEHYPETDDFVRVIARRSDVVLNGEDGDLRCRELIVLGRGRFGHEDGDERPDPPEPRMPSRAEMH